MLDAFVWDVKRDCLLSQNSLRRRRHLNPVSNVCEVAPISLISAGAPNGLNELPEVRLEFPFKLIGKGFLRGQSRRVLQSWYKGWAQNKDFGAVSQTDLNRSVFPSVAQDSIKTDNGNDDSGDDSYGDSVGGGFWW